MSLNSMPKTKILPIASTKTLLKTNLTFSIVISIAKQAFIKVFILYYCDPKCYILIEISVFRYVISGILIQLILESS